MAQEQSQQPSLVGQEISGCEILQKIAVGGMGAVYKARHKALDRIVCVKILSPALTNDKKAVELFLTEARAIAELEHPNIVQVYNVGREKGYYFIVMGFIEGQTLSQLVKRNKTLPLETILKLFEEVLLGLDAAHAKGIIHRDIKPSNILINTDGQAKIVDFGIAKKVDKEKGTTKTTELAGTAYFIAPEQALGRELDTRADLYSVGASLYYVLTGQFPYNGKNTIDIIQKHINDPVPNPAALRPGMPAWLSAAVQKLMAKKPEDRFQTAKETYVYFQKARAEEQLRIQKGSSINLGDNSSLKLVQEEKFSTTELQRKRQAEKSLKKSTQSNKPSLLPSVDKAAVLPVTANAAKPVDPSSIALPTASEAATKGIYSNPASGALEQALRQKARWAGDMIKDLLLKLPVFILFTIGVGYVFYHLGNICSAGIIEHDGLLANLINPFFAKTFQPQQWLYMLLGVVTLGLIFASAAVKEYSRATVTLFLLAFVSYMAGLFSPQVPFLQTGHIWEFLFTPQYYLCYLVVAFAGAVAVCSTYNRTILQGALGGALVILVVALAYLSSHLSIPPAEHVVQFQILFFAGLFATVVAVYYLLNREERTSVIMPLFILLLAMGCLWVYNVSGLVQTAKHTSEALVQNIDVKNLFREAPAPLPEEDYGLPNRPKSPFVAKDNTNEVSVMEDQQAHDFLATQFAVLAPNAFDEENTALFSRLLRRYYKGGQSNLNTTLWEYALTLPLHRFNQNAQTNSAYTFLMLLLMMLSVGFCVCGIFFKSEEEE
ncbi:MAG: serine/threonine protein kinase [Elusimicrobiaceae bacterium]|nr:serine/threonine protein kinase [Elusimicrobiaceae bacterium]